MHAGLLCLCCRFWCRPCMPSLSKCFASRLGLSTWSRHLAQKRAICLLSCGTAFRAVDSWLHATAFLGESCIAFQGQGARHACRAFPSVPPQLGWLRSRDRQLVNGTARMQSFALSLAFCGGRGMISEGEIGWVVERIILHGHGQ